MVGIILTLGMFALLAYGILFNLYGKEAFSDDKNERFDFWKMTLWYWVSIVIGAWLLMLFYG